LTTNAIMHAFNHRSSGEIALRLWSESDELVHMTFADDGCGFPPDRDWRTADTLGLQLVRMLTEQLQGTINVSAGAGTSFELSFSRLSKGKGTHQQAVQVEHGRSAFKEVDSK
jgi:two-component sensor histidine kinase